MTVQEQIVANASRYGVDPQLALAVAKNESSFQQSAVSSAGAIGVMQLMPPTAEWLGVNPHDASQNIEGGVRYLSMLLDQFAGDVSKAVAAYNAGPGRVSRGGALPEETQTYVARVMADYGVSRSEPTFSIDVWGSPLSNQTTEVQRAGLGSSATLLALLIGLAGLAVAAESD